MSAIAEIVSNSVRLRFSAPWDLPAHELFIRAKQLPEAKYEFDRDTDSYEVTAPARFAPLVGLELPAINGAAEPLAKFLFPVQRWIVEMALAARRFAVWADCFLPDTLIWTDGEYRRIDSCAVGMSIQTMHGPADICRFMSRPFSGEVCCIKTASGFHPLRVTPNHKFYIWRNGEVCLCDAESLKETDNLFFRKNESTSRYHSPSYLALAGFWLAEGWIARRAGKLRRVHLGFNRNEESTHIAEVQDICAKMNLPCRLERVPTKPNVTTVVIEHRGLAKQLTDDFGEYSHAKRLPAWFFELRPEDQRILIGSLFKGDGQVRIAPHKNERLKESIRFVTTSYSMASGVRDALLGMGIRCSGITEQAKVDSRGQSHRTCYRILISRRFMHNFGYDIKVKRRDLSEVECAIDGRKFTLIPIRKLWKEAYQGPVYNLTSSGHDSYLTDGGISKNCGFGKTPMGLEWARQVSQRTGGKVVIICPKQLIGQWRYESEKFYPGQPAPVAIRSREAFVTWLKDGADRIAMVSHHLFVAGVIDEVRYCAGVILEESSILKGGGGVIKWNLIKSCRGIEYKLSLTATPAPNDTMEYASQASWLEKLRNEGEILWTYFMRDPQTQTWKVRPHAREAFYRFMSSWSIYISKGSAYGFEDKFDLPEPAIIEHKLEMTTQQAAEHRRLTADMGGDLLGKEKLGVRERSKFSQLAKGFVYGDDKTARRFPSVKPCTVARLVREGLSNGRQVLIWTVFDEESDIILEQLAGEPVVGLHGKDSEDDREDKIERFRRGEIRGMVSKARLLGYGQNFQFCSLMVFSGFDDSFEAFYQAVRRAHRYGATERLTVHVPFIPELEQHMWNNLLRKRGQWEADITEQERNYVEAMKGLVK